MATSTFPLPKVSMYASTPFGLRPHPTMPAEAAAEAIDAVDRAVDA